MISQVLRRIDEMVQYVEHTCNQLVRDSRVSSQVSLGELDTANYQLALHHLHVALEALHRQQQIMQRYLQVEEENELADSPQDLHKRTL